MKHQKLKTTPEISQRMANIKLKRGDSEAKLAKALWHKGKRYRLNYRKLPGSPDIVLTKAKIAIFIDGEFWHGYDWVNRNLKLKSNREYWVEKIEENIDRDNRNNLRLRDMGWISIRFWEKEIKNDFDKCLNIIISTIGSK